VSKYDVYDGQIRAVLSCARGTVGLVFREDGKRRYVFAITPEENRVRLLLEEDGRQKVLQERTDARLQGMLGGLPGEPPGEEGPGRGQALRQIMGRLFFLTVRLKGTQIQAVVNAQPPLEATDATVGHGQVGFYADRAKAMFHSLNVAGPAE
jgi:hypothetical protein